MERPPSLIHGYVGRIAISIILACAGAMTAIHASETTLPPTAGSDSFHPLEILQPRAGLDARNRFYKTYPGLEYEVRLAVAGGSYPYRFSVTTGPAGLAIDGRGVISWPNPPASPSAYPVTIRVQDNRGAEQSVSWSILVTTDKFLFVDPVNGHVGASGTIADPLKGFADVYGGTNYAAKYATANQDAFVYFKDGATYVPNGYNSGDGGIQWTNKQPLVWLPYPGSHPVIDMSTAAFRFVDTPVSNLYIDGFEVDGLGTDAATEMRMAFRIGSSGSNITLRKNTIHGIAATSGSYNQSAIMISADAHGENWAFQDNRFHDIHHAYGILGYSACKVLVEDNIFWDMTDSHQIGPKCGTRFWFIRHNQITDCDGFGIWIYGGDEGRGPYGSMDISYNRVEMASGYALQVNQSYEGVIGRVDAYRNTLKGDVGFVGVTTSTGPFKSHNNVIINGRSSGIELIPTPAPSSYEGSDNLVGTTGAGIIDAQALLTSSYEAHLGTRGWQTTAPAGANTAPAISSVVDSSIPVNGTTGAIPFTISDAETAAASLTVTRSSSNPTLVPTASIVIGGSGANRTVTVTPAAGLSGTATITITVSDGSLSAQEVFLLTVAADTTPPATPSAPAVSSLTSSTPTLSGIVEAGATVIIYDDGSMIGTTTADGSGHWSWTVAPALATGDHSLSIAARDAAGNASAASPVVVVTVPSSPDAGTAADGADGGDNCGTGGLACMLLLALGLRRRQRP